MKLPIFDMWITNIWYVKSTIFDIWNHQYLISRCTIFMFVFIWYFCKIDIEVGSTVFVVISLQEMTKVFKILRQPCLYSLEQKITKFYPYYYAIKKLVSPERNIEGTQDSVQLCESQTSHYNALKIWQRVLFNLPVDWVSQLAFNFWPHKLITHSPYLLMAKWFNLYG